MAEVHYLISDAAKKAEVEAHVLRYWEDELGLEIPRKTLASLTLTCTNLSASSVAAGKRRVR